MEKEQKRMDEEHKNNRVIRDRGVDLTIHFKNEKERKRMNEEQNNHVIWGLTIVTIHFTNAKKQKRMDEEHKYNRVIRDQGFDHCYHTFHK